MTLSPLDQALALRIAKKQDDALRAAIAMLEGQPEQVGAAWLIGRILVDRKRPLVAGEAAARLVDAYVRRGDLPASTLCAHLANDAGDPAGPLFEAIARAFGKGSARLQDIAPSPPPLPKAPAIAADLKIASGDALLSRAERALTSFLASEDETDTNAPLPTLPLFSSLEPKALAQLLGATGVREIAEKEFILQHGEEGSEAFVVVRGLFHAVREDVTLAALGAGGIFGEMALVSDAPRAASVQAKEPSVVLVIGRRVLENLAARIPAIG